MRNTEIQRSSMAAARCLKWFSSIYWITVEIVGAIDNPAVVGQDVGDFTEQAIRLVSWFLIMLNVSLERCGMLDIAIVTIASICREMYDFLERLSSMELISSRPVRKYLILDDITIWNKPPGQAGKNMVSL